MSWSDVYLFCFLVGVTLSVLAFLAGAGHIHVPLKWHVHLHLHLPHGHGGSHGAGTQISWFNASTILAFLAWFGGIGYMLTRYSHLQTFFVVGIATFAGLAAGWLMLRFLIKLVGSTDEPLTEEERRVEGALAVVSMTIREGGTGEIIFPLGGARRCSGARSVDGSVINKGTEVVIERYEKGIAYVKRWEEFVNS